MNILTFDIEEWYVWESLGLLSSQIRREHDQMLNRLLDVLEAGKIKATFFCVGRMAADFPDVVKRIREKGHEIGCHSNTHSWLNKMSEKECFEDTRTAIDSLEQCIGEKITSYRAPAFSIGEQNKWAFGILAQNGIERDSSVFPAKRELGGFPSFGTDSPSLVICGNKTIKEFPVAITSLAGKRTAFSGGGYFRFLPYGFCLSRMKKRNYNICYFHMSDFVKERRLSRQEYETYFKKKAGPFSTFIRSAKTNIGKGKSWKNFERLLGEMDFMSLAEADSLVDWSAAPSAIKI